MAGKNFWCRGATDVAQFQRVDFEAARDFKFVVINFSLTAKKSSKRNRAYAAGEWKFSTNRHVVVNNLADGICILQMRRLGRTSCAAGNVSISALTISFACDKFSSSQRQI